MSKCDKPKLIQPCATTGSIYGCNAYFRWSNIWDADGNNTSYDLQIDKNGSFDVQYVINSDCHYDVTIQHFPLTGDWRVRAKKQGYTDSDWAYGTYNRQQSMKPYKKLPSGTVSAGSILFRWEQLASTIGTGDCYRLQVATNNTFYQQSIIYDVMIDITAEKYLTIINNGTYYWRVKVNDNYAGIWCNTGTFTVVNGS